MSVQEREDDSKAKHLVIAFNTLQVLGLVLLLALLAPALFSSNIKRTATWFGMIVSGIIYCASYLILTFIGGQGGSEPSAGASIFFSQCTAYSRVFPKWCFLSTQLLASSSLLFLIGVLEALATGLKNPGDVRRNGSHLYCHLTTPEITLVFCILGVIISFATIIAEVAMVVIMRKTIVKLRRQSSSPNIELPTSLLNTTFESAPIGGVVTFATQKDILYFYFRSESWYHAAVVKDDSQKFQVPSRLKKRDQSVMASERDKKMDYVPSF
ncbi:hypothetical protein EDD85DRAFT_790475 [Armillaria nabsnona]|nr:hypothetical protein EDD85DRAFT_790475 [Armillaria nabsnona]